MAKVQYSYQSPVIAGQARILQNRMLYAVFARVMQFQVRSVF